MFPEFISSATIFELQLPTAKFTMMEDLGLPRPEAIPPCLACLGPPPPKFDLPPPPRPPWEANDGCAKQHTDSLARPLQPDDSTGTQSLYVENNNYQSCDINPFVIDSNFYFGENLFTVLIIVICSCILVAIIMTVAIVIYRRRSMFRRLYSDGSKSIPSLQAPTASSSDNRSQFEATSNSKPFDDPMEMADRHVYANPSYPSHFEAAIAASNSASNSVSNSASNNAATMQIGGLPFYLPRDAPESTHQKHNDNPSPLIRSPTATPRKGIVQLQDPTGAIAWYNNSSLRPPQPQQRPSLGPGPLLSPRGGQKIRENAADNDIGGPIYEDIDRMCSYRGYPPPGTATNSNNTSGGLIGPLASSSDSYYNLSGGSSSPRNKSSNNSETSFEGGSGCSTTMASTSRLHHRSPPQTSRTASSTRPPIKGNSSMYYYSDTLRKGRVGSDSGISVDTPPPRTSMQPRGHGGHGGQSAAVVFGGQNTAFTASPSSDQKNRQMIQTEAIFNDRRSTSKKKSSINDTKV